MPKKTTVQGSLENVYCDKCGKIIGFKFGVRLPRYRGNMLSLINGYYVNVDGVEYPQDKLRFIINGKPPRTFEEIKKAVWEHWDHQTIGYIFVEQEGGLSKGEHTVIATVSNFEQYGYRPGDGPMSDQYKVDNVIVPGPGGSGFGGPAVPMVQVLE